MSVNRSEADRKTEAATPADLVKGNNLLGEAWRDARTAGGDILKGFEAEMAARLYKPRLQTP